MTIYCRNKYNYIEIHKKYQKFYIEIVLNISCLFKLLIRIINLFLLIILQCLSPLTL